MFSISPLRISPHVSPKSSFGKSSVVSQDSPRGTGGADHQLFAGAKGPGEGYGAPGQNNGVILGLYLL